MKIDVRQLPKAALDFVKPMQALAVEKLPSGPLWRYEVKLDGYRLLVMKKNGAVTLFSRRGNILNTQFPRIAVACSFLPKDTMIDGELVALDKDGRPSFAALQHRQFTPDAPGSSTKRTKVRNLLLAVINLARMASNTCSSGITRGKH